MMMMMIAENVKEKSMTNVKEQRNDCARVRSEKKKRNSWGLLLIKQTIIIIIIDSYKEST